MQIKYVTYALLKLQKYVSDQISNVSCNGNHYHHTICNFPNYIKVNYSWKIKPPRENQVNKQFNQKKRQNKILPNPMSHFPVSFVHNFLDLNTIFL